jgi:hypothetical protein
MLPALTSIASAGEGQQQFNSHVNESVSTVSPTELTAIFYSLTTVEFVQLFTGNGK